MNTGYKAGVGEWLSDGVKAELVGEFMKLTFQGVGNGRVYKAEEFTIKLEANDWVNISYEAYASRDGVGFQARTYDVATERKLLSTTPKIYDTSFQLSVSRRLSLFIFGNVGDIVYIRFIKTRKGRSRTPWTPAPEDIEDSLKSKADQVLTQEQLNKLAERDNVLKAELEAKAALSIVERWIKEIQNLTAVEEAGRKSAETAIAKASERMIDLQRKVGELQTVTEFVNTYMSQSEEGLIVGRKDGSSKVLVSPDRISFVSGGKEVASISQGVLKIDNGVFVKSLRIGRFVTMQDPTNPDRNLTMYVGGA